MNQAVDYITQEKRQELLAELENLKGPKRKEILEALRYAKSLGDISENAEYHQAREDQGNLETRILKIKKILQSSETVVGGGGDVIEIGSKVTVQRVQADDDKQMDEKREYTVVGSEEADMSLGKVSNRSPLGQALFGKKKGGEVSFTTPKGTANYKILDVA
jgi:transcription elongation factor GreA